VVNGWGGDSDVGGLVGQNSGGTLSHTYWDKQTSGQLTIGIGADNNSQSGNVTGKTTAQLQGVLPSGFSDTVWGTGSGLYPYLLWQYPTAPQAISGIAYSDAGVTALASATVSAVIDGASFASVTTGANGYYYILAAPGTLSGTQQVLTYLNGNTTKANTYIQSPTGTVSNADLYGGYLRLVGAATSLSSFGTALSMALGSNSGSDFLFTLSGNTISLKSAANLEISDDNFAFVIDQAISTTGTVILNMGGTTSQSAPITAGSLALDGAHAGYILTNAANAVGTLADFNNNHALNFVDSGSLTIGTVGSDSGIAGFTSVRITAGGNLTVNASVSSLNQTTLIAAGDLTIASGATISSAGLVTLSTTGRFVNNEGADAVSSTHGYWLIYSANPTGDTFGNLDSANYATWNTTYRQYVANRVAGADLNSGNRYIFANQPTLTFTTTNLSKVYGTDDAAAVATAYTVTGYDPGVAHAYLADTATSVFSGGPSLSSAGAAAIATVAGGPYAIDITDGTLAALNGYAFSFASTGKLTVNPATLTVTYGVANASSTYGTLATLGAVTLTGVQNADVGNLAGVVSLFDGSDHGVTLSATLNAGSYVEMVTSLTGSAASNYVIAETGNTNGTLTINPKTLTVSLTGTVSKTYDGTTAATLANGNYSLSGIVSGDTVVLNDPSSGSYDTKNAGTDKTVSVGGLSLSGESSGNYTLASTSISGAIGTIDPKTLTVSLTGTLSKTYDGTTAATLADGNYSLSGIVSGDTVVLNDPTSGSYDTKNAGTDKTVSVGGLSLSGESSGNYTLASTSISGAIGTIDPKTLTVSLTGTVSKTYDGTTAATLANGNYSLTGIVSGDAVALNDPSSGSYDTKNAGTDKTVSVGSLSLSGESAGNYTLASTSISGAIGTINQASLTVSVNDASRGVGFANPAFSVTVLGLVGGDTASVLSGLTVSTTADLASPAGTYELISSGGVATNYVITVREDGTLTITPAGEVPGLNNALPASKTNYNGQSQGGHNPDGTTNDDSGITGASGTLICDVSNSDSSSETCSATN